MANWKNSCLRKNGRRITMNDIINQEAIDEKEQKRKDRVAEASRRHSCGQELLDEWDRVVRQFRKRAKA